MKVDPRLGTELGGYRIEELIGRGGMSAVYLAEDLRLGRKVALKLLSPELAEDERFQERFVRESRLAASLEHPNIVPIYEAGEADDVLFIAMRYIGGTDLKAVVKSKGALDPPRALTLLGQVADALDAAHARGLVHRDVKPANILISPPPVPGATEHAYLSDFGLTKRASSDSGITATGQFVGTLDYAAPEQFEGRPLDGRTDVYSLACVLFECLTGEVPYRRDQDAALMYAHLMAPVPKVTDAHPGLSEAIEEVVARGMAKAPDDRFASGGELVRSAREALGEPRGDFAMPAVRTGELRRERLKEPVRRPERRRSLIGLAAIVGLVMVITGTLMTLTQGGTKSGTGGRGKGSAAGVDAKAVAIDPRTGRPVAAVGLGKGTGTLAVGFGSVWVANQEEDTVARIDPKAKELLRTIHVGHRPAGIAVGEGDPHVWVITSGGLWAIDPLTNAVVATINLPNLPLGIAVAQGSVWVTYKISEDSPQGLFRIDPNSRGILQRISVAEGPLNPSPVGVAIAPDAVWAVTPVGPSRGLFIRVDLGSGRRIEESIERPVGIGIVADSVWGLQANGVVLRADLSTPNVVARIATETGAAAIAVSEEALWVVNRARGTLTRIDPAANTASLPVELGGKPSAVAVGEGMVWVRLDGTA